MFGFPAQIVKFKPGAPPTCFQVQVPVFLILRMYPDKGVWRNPFFRKNIKLRQCSLARTRVGPDGEAGTFMSKGGSTYHLLIHMIKRMVVYADLDETRPDTCAL